MVWKQNKQYQINLHDATIQNQSYCSKDMNVLKLRIKLENKETKAGT
jgi:hypothetical protein